MFPPSIALTNAAINSIKAELAKTLPDVKSSHRAEALARGFGFATNAALRAELASSKARRTMFDWISSADYLLHHGFSPAAKPFFLAVGRVAITQTLKNTPALCMNGFGVGDAFRRADGSFETSDEYEERFRKARSEFVEDNSVEEFLRALDLVGSFQKIKSISNKSYSYGLKHVAERRPCTYPDGAFLGPHYVSNGALIAAAINAGFKHRRIENGLNAYFNMSQKSTSEAWNLDRARQA